LNNKSTMMDKLRTQALENLKAMLRPQDRRRLRPDGLLEPQSPPLHLCGGLEAPYLVGRATLDWESATESSELAQAQSTARP